MHKPLMSLINVHFSILVLFFTNEKKLRKFNLKLTSIVSLICIFHENVSLIKKIIS